MDLCDPRLAKRARLLLPWETGFLSEVIGTGSQPGHLCLDYLNPVWDVRWLHQSSKEQSTGIEAGPFTAGEKLQGASSSYKLVGTKHSVIPWSDKLLEDRSVALERWKLIIDLQPRFSRVGRQLLACSDSACPGERAEAILKDTFEGKSTSTLNARSSSMLAYARWHAVTRISWTIFPVCEDACYDYLCEMRVAKKPPTFGRRFVEAMGFCHGVLGLEGAEECIASRRLSGASLSLLSRKEFDKQCDDFEVAHLKLLEHATVNLDSGPDKVFSGFNTFKTHARCRHSDTFHCCDEPLLDIDSSGFGYLEVSVTGTKTGRSAAKLKRKLPLVAHAIGITGLRWAEAYMDERKAQGLDASNGPLMPGVSFTGHWTANRLSSGDANIWLRELILKLGGCIRPGMFIASHSCKHTLLAWMAKFGIAVGTRRILGGHVKPKEGSTLVYSRDALAGPLRQLQVMLESVQNSTFNPDATRSGRFLDDKTVQDSSAASTRNTISHPNISGNCFSEPRPKRLSSPPPQEGNAKENSREDGLKFWDTAFLDWEDVKVSEEAEIIKQVDSDDEGFPSGEPSLVKFQVECVACGALLSSKFYVFECDDCGLEGCESCISFICGVDHVSRCYQCHDSLVVDKTGQSDSGSSSSSSSESESDDSEREAILNSEKVAEYSAKLNPLTSRPASSTASGSLFQHKTLKTLHLGRLGSSNLLACGRSYSKVSHDEFEHDPSFQWPRCKDCFGRVLHSSNAESDQEPVH